jgi:type II secretory pathway component GspD/PulD (secretin)
MKTGWTYKTLAATTILGAMLMGFINQAKAQDSALPTIVIEEQGETYTFGEPEKKAEPQTNAPATPAPKVIEDQKTGIEIEVENETPAPQVRFGKEELTQEAGTAEEPAKLGGAGEVLTATNEGVQLTPDKPVPNIPALEVETVEPTPATQAVNEPTTEVPTNIPTVVLPSKTEADPGIVIRKEPEIAEEPKTAAETKPTPEAGKPATAGAMETKPAWELEETTAEKGLELPEIEGPTPQDAVKAPDAKGSGPALEDLANGEGMEKITAEDAEALIKFMAEEGRKRDGTRARRIPNLRQEEMTFENVPLGRMLRLLAEQAGFNFIEPALPNPDEMISFRFQNMTPLEAFMQIAKARGFSVVTRNGVTTLKRSDIVNPEFMIVKKYNLRYAQPKWVIQQIANLLGIDTTPPAEVLASFPAPDDAALTYGGQNSGGGGGSGGSGGGTSSSGSTSQNIGLPTAPRWTASLPFDEPAYKGTGGTGEPSYVFIDRGGRALVVRASPADHEMIKEYVTTMDVPEPQIMIEVKFIELKVDNSVDYGTDWSTMLEKGLKVKMEGTETFDWGSIVFGAAGGTAGQLTLSVENAEVVIRAFERFGNGKVTNMPKTMTRSSVPVSISSTVTEATPAYQLSTTTGGVGSVSTPSNYNTFTTGMTIDLVPQLMANGIVDVNMNPTVSNRIGETVIPAAGSTPEQVIPVISSRAITTSASVPSGMTIMVGGLTSLSDGVNNAGIPVLSQIPFLGKTVFGNTAKTKTRQTMIIFVTPTVIWPDEYQKVYTDEEEWETMKAANRVDFEQENTPLPNATVIRRARPVPDTLHAPTKSKKR